MAVDFLNFCCRSGGSNLNAGTLLGDTTVPGTAASFTYAGTFATNTFTVSSGDPSAAGVTAGMFVHVSDGAIPGRLAKIASVTSTTIVLDATQSSVYNAGTYIECRVGGAWAGPNGTDFFPLTALKDPAPLGNATKRLRINFKNDVIYGTTTASTAGTANGNGYVVQGFASAYGDGGRATYQGLASGASYILYTAGQYVTTIDFIFDRNGSTGTVQAVVASSNQFASQFIRCSATNIRGSGFYGLGTYIECEAAFCNTSNTAGAAGFLSFAGSGGVMTCINCVSHDNYRHGFALGFGGMQCINCIAFTNTETGFSLTNTGNNQNNLCLNCDSYSNTIDGFAVAAVTSFIINCNAVKNGGYGFRLTTGNSSAIKVRGGIGYPASGANANALGGLLESGTPQLISLKDDLAYVGTTYGDAANGDFRLTGSVLGAGYGILPIAWGSLSARASTVSYPDIGAAQAIGGSSASRMVNIRGGADQ